MSDVIRILSEIEQGDPNAARQLLPLVYEELRKLAAQKLAHEKSGQTLQPTAPVHEAFLRLVDGNATHHWDSRGHFFAASAEGFAADVERYLEDQTVEACRPRRGIGAADSRDGTRVRTSVRA